MIFNAVQNEYSLVFKKLAMKPTFKRDNLKLTEKLLVKYGVRADMYNTGPLLQGYFKLETIYKKQGVGRDRK
jgi:hypothetical protein